MIEIKNLSKRFGSLEAVKNLSFSVPQGQVLGFLGPNGAGKSTTMKMLTGFITPSAGQIRICGFDIESQPIEAKRCIGYLPEGAPSYGEMTTLQFLHFVADMRGLSQAQRGARLDEVVGLLHLHGVLHQTIETLSKGYRRRVGLAQALLHDPRVLILDEPTDGLDPNQKHEVRALIGDLSKEKTVIISTHILEEVEAVCDRAIIIANGQLKADATPAELEAKSPYHNAVRITLADADGAAEAIGQLPGVMRVEVDAEAGRLIALPQAQQAPFSAIAELARQKDWQVQELVVERGRLDEVFRHITVGGAGDEVRT